MKDTANLKDNRKRYPQNFIHKDEDKQQAQRNGSSWLSFRAKIYLGIGGICVLLFLVAGIMLLTINDTLRQNQRFSSNISQVAEEVKKVSGSIRDSLVEHRQQYATFLDTQGNRFTQQLSSQRTLYEDIVSVGNSLLDAQVSTDLIIIEGKRFNDIAEKVENLRHKLDRFFKSADIQGLDKELMKGAKQAGHTYLDLFDQMRELDTQNVPLSQMVDLANEARAVGKSLQTEIKKIFVQLIENNHRQTERVNSSIAKKTAELNAADERTLEHILRDQNGIKEGVNHNVEEVKEIASSLIKKRVYLAVTCTAVIFLAIVFSLIIVPSITKPIKGVANMLEDIAQGEGDLTKRLNVSTRDEIGNLARWFNLFIENLQKIIKDIVGKAENMSTSSADLSSLSGDMSSGADTMSGRSNTIASATQEVSTTINSVAVVMEKTAKNVGVVASAADEMMASINEIAKSSEKARSIAGKAVSEAKGASDKVDELGKAAKDIDKVTETITEISEQTNLLALNATIEAARAGEAGKGFAVVANEIKELARQTAGATGEIRNKIEGIQSSTAGTVSEIEQISKVINEVNEIITIIASAMEEQLITNQEIANNVARVSQGIQEATEHVTHGSAVSREIAKDISEVNQAADEMSNNSSQLNISAQELSTLARQLKDMVMRLKI